MTFLDQLAGHLLQLNIPTDRIAVVMANRRAEVFLKKALGKISEKALIAPRMMPVESFIEELSGWRVQGQTTLIFTLYEAYRQTLGEKADPFDQFLKWSNWVLQDFNEIDRYLIDAQKVYRNLEDIKVLESWGLGPDETPRKLMQNYMEFWHELPLLYENYKRLLESQGWAYQGMAYRKASEEMEAHLDSFLAEKGIDHVVFAGFNAMNSAEEKIVTGLLASGKAEILWDADSYYLDDPDQEAGHFIRKFKKRNPHLFKDGMKWVGDHLGRDEKDIRILGINGQVAQAKLAGQIIGSLTDEPDEKTALVLADEAMLIPVVQSLPPDLPPSNITMGVALGHLPMSTGLSLLIDMHERALSNPRVKRGFAPAFYYRDLESFIQSDLGRFVVGGPKNGQKILAELRKNNLIYLTPDEIITRFELTGSEVDSLKIHDNPRDLSQTLSGLLSSLASRSEGLGAIDQEALFSLFSLLNRLTDLLERYPVVEDIRTYRMLFHSLLKEETLSFYGEPLSGLQVLGVLETRNLDFDTLIITSMNEGILPAGKANNSFIPYDLKREVGLPTYEEKDAIYAYHFYRLIQRAKTIYLIHNTNQDTTGGGEQSRFLTQLEMEYPIKTGNPLTPAVTLSGNATSDSLRTSHPIKKGPEMEPALRRLAERGISPSALNTYLRDPMEFYQKYVLRLREEEEAEEIAGFDTLGNVVHHVLENCFTPFIGSFPPVDKIKDWIDHAEDLAEAAFEKHYPNGNIREGKNHLIFKVAVRMVRDFLSSEIRSLSMGVPRIESLESELKTSVEVPGWDGPVTIKGKADRIDTLNGKVRIIDYKTGNVDLNPLRKRVDIWEGDKHKIHIQLLIYQWLYEKEKGINDSAGVVFSTRQPSKSYQVLSTPDMSEPDEVLEWFEEGLLAKVGEILTLDEVFQDNRLNLI